MPRSAAAGDPGPTHPAGSSGRGWSARQGGRGNQPVRAGTAQQHLLAKPCKETGGGLILPLRSHVAQPQPTPAPTGKEKGEEEEDTVGRSPAVDRMRMRWTSPVDNTALFPLFYLSRELTDGFVYLLPRASPAARHSYPPACLPYATFIALELPILRSLTHGFRLRPAAARNRRQLRASSHAILASVRPFA